MQTRLLIAAALLLSGCVTMAESEEPLPNGERIPLGRAAYVNGPIIKIVKVTDDSRCPINAICVWQGTVKVEAVWLRPTGKNQKFNLELQKPQPLADGTIELTRVEPGRVAGENGDIGTVDYRFTLKFDGGI